jgi:UDP-N-acetylmuramoylalanine-D-glutamate ligase
MGGAKVVVYGLSTEGYAMACQMAIKGADVSIIDESAPSAISLKSEIAKTYPNVSSLKEDEPLLSMEPIDIATSKAKYLFFAPRIRKTGQDIK